MTYIGIDPGLSGGLAMQDRAGTLHVEPMPTLTVRRKLVLCESAIADWLSQWSPVTLALVEAQGFRPVEGRGSVFKTGYGYGVLCGALAALGIPYQTIQPAQWKKRAGCPKDKDGARYLAMRYWPDERAFLPKKADGLAEAALLARLAREIAR